MALVSTRPITEIVPGIFPEGKGGRCVRLTTLPHSCADCLEIWEPKPPSGSVHGLVEMYLVTLCSVSVSSPLCTNCCISGYSLHFVLCKIWSYFLILK